MNRLQKKCVIVSTGMHLLLAGIILIGPAFTGTKPAEPIREINFVPSIIVDANVAGGGNPNAQPPAAVKPPQLQPQPRPEPKQADPPPEPKKTPEVVKPSTAEPDDFSDRKQKRPQIVTTPVTRPKQNSTSKTTTNDTQAQERQLLDARRRAGQEALRAAANIREGTSAATAIDVDVGPGGGGPAYAGYASWVQSVYQNAWIALDDTASDAAVTKARVTIANDGRVISSEIISRSGDSQMDSSIQRTLDRVTTVGRSFPEGVKEKQRTYILKFDLKVKRGLA